MTALVEPGVFDFPLTLGPGLEADRPALRAAMRDAQRRIVQFAAAHGWIEHVGEPFAREARVLDRKADFDRTILELTASPPVTLLPRSYVAALEDGVLASVSPELYRTCCPDQDEPAAFEKLLAHELAHRLHIRTLGGFEDDMGPAWFFEGLACYAAGQFAAEPARLPAGRAHAILRATGRGPYREYAALFRLLARRAAVPDLVARARKPGFDTWAAGMLDG